MTTAAKPKRIGRPTKPPLPGERVALGLRVTADITQKLDEAAERTGRSQSQEAEIRLERTFTEEDQFGGPEMLNMARLMAAAFLRGGQAGARARGHPKWSLATWMEDPTCYVAAISAVADALRAAGPIGLKFGDDLTAETRDLKDERDIPVASLIGGRGIKVTKKGE